MAVSNVKPWGPQGKFGSCNNFIGTGTPAATDALITDINTYPIGTRYFDKTLKRTYTRIAVAGNTLADYLVSPVGIETGAGIPATTRLTDIVAYPIGSMYYDSTNKFLYIRTTTSNGTIADWLKSTVYA